MHLEHANARPTGGRMALAASDLVLLSLALIASLGLKFDSEPLALAVKQQILNRPVSTILAVATFCVLLSVFRLYRYEWRYAGLHTAASVVLASTLGAICMAGIELAVDGQQLSWSVLIVFWCLSTMAIGSSRLILRSVCSRIGATCDNSEGRPRSRRRTILVGPAETSLGVTKAMEGSRRLPNYEIIGIVDGQKDKIGTYYSNLPVLGVLDDLSGLLNTHRIDEVIFALPESYDWARIREHVLKCRREGVEVKVIPNVSMMLTGPSQLVIEDVRVEDLLRRPARSVDIRQFAGHLKGRRILVTGAGGSIGSEICRQLAKLAPAELVLLGHGENSIFSVYQELRSKVPDLRVVPVITSITNAGGLDRVFARFRPDVVFHAGAHKHVSLMEENICEAVHNNVVGTANVVNACLAHNVRTMVQISTDKAADPRCVMGATKWLGERIVRSAAARSARTSFVCVRFGNVLGSRGSVIPLFEQQIKSGGPVTVTHPEMTRYFMTIPEAVRLVIQAGSVGNSGEVYLLDMGRPVKILDLAEDMIRLYGHEPNVDIEVVFTGIRPGEKLHEQLHSTSEVVEESPWEGLRRVICQPSPSYEEMMETVDDLRVMAELSDGGGIRDAFRGLVMGFGSAPCTEPVKQSVA